MNIDPRLFNPPVRAMVMPWSLSQAGGCEVTVVSAPHRVTLVHSDGSRRTGQLACQVEFGYGPAAPYGNGYGIEANALLVIGHDPDRALKESWRHLGRTKIKSAPV